MTDQTTPDADSAPDVGVPEDGFPNGRDPNGNYAGPPEPAPPVVAQPTRDLLPSEERRQSVAAGISSKDREYFEPEDDYKPDPSTVMLVEDVPGE